MFLLAQLDLWLPVAYASCCAYFLSVRSVALSLGGDDSGAVLVRDNQRKRAPCFAVAGASSFALKRLTSSSCC